MYNQAQFNNSMNEYIHETKKRDFKDNVKNIMVLIIAILHRFIGYPYLSELLRNVLNDNNVSEMTIEYVLFGYLIVSVLFEIIAAWKIVRSIKIINFIYIILVIAYIGFFGYDYFKTTKIYDQINNKPTASFVIETKEILNKAKTYWQKETITNTSRETSYIKKNNIYCNNKKFAITDDNVEYFITINVNGYVTKYIITNGKFMYSYNGDNLQLDDITIDKFIKVDESNSILIPNCN